MTADLVAFLRARLDEDEQGARDAADGDSGAWFVGDKWNVYRVEDEAPVADAEENRLVVYGNVKSQSEHIARHDPARVLAEVDAKRRIIDGLAEALDRHADYITGTFTVEDVLRLLALPFRDHPHYQPEWAPDGG